jgi:hypothetical protein
LTKVLDGTWDAKAYRIKFDARAKDEASSARLITDVFGKISGTVRTHSYDPTLRWMRLNGAKYPGTQTQGALDCFKQLFTAFSNGRYEEALAQSEAVPANGLVWTYFRPMLLVARLDALQRLKRPEWRDIALQAVDQGSDPNILMGLTDALTLPDSKLTEKDPSIALKAAEKLTGLARAPMFLLRLAWAQWAGGQGDKARATVAEAMSKMPEEKKQNPRTYDSLMARLREAEAYMDRP